MSYEPRDPTAASTEPKVAALLSGVEHGQHTAIMMMRGGRLRLSPLPWERDKWPYKYRIKPVKSTLLIWRSWLGEVMHGGY